MKVGIIGYGFVGRALHSSFKENVTTQIVDPKLNKKLDNLKSFKPNIVFISVPTPMKKDSTQDISILRKVLKDLSKLKLSSLIVLKSTILPSNLIKVKKIMPKLILNPEFLRERYASEDFISSEMILFGGKLNNTKKLEDFYRKHTKCKCEDYVHTDLISSSLVKYTINTFLATKVIFFNEIFNVFNKSGTKINWSSFIKILEKDSRMGKSHMMVPGPDNRLGFGGACFPKDITALINYSIELNEKLSLLEKTVQINNQIRGKYKNKTLREVEQNISFNKKR
tara:strand:+ start:991 stop:1836 length:846 start_codon:yes stop_codon:yes gene_type:complete